MTPEDLLTEAKRAMAAGDHAAAYALFERLDLSSLETMVAVRTMLQKGQCARALGRQQENIRLHAEALARLTADREIGASPQNAALALSLAVGAQDAAQSARLVRTSFGDLPPMHAGWSISPVVSAAAWSKKNGVHVMHLEPSRKYAATEEEKARGRDYSYVTEPTWYADVPGAQIVSGWDFAFTPQGEVLAGANYMPLDKSFPFMPHAYCPTVPAVAHVWPADVVGIDEDALFLSTPERHHYGHWLIEFLPRLRAWNRAETPRRKLAISASLPQKHRDLLALFGARGDDIVECDLGKRYAFRSLRIVRTGRAGAPHPEDIAFLSAALSPGPSPVRSKIYFLTRDAGTRVPANMVDVRAVFAAFGVAEVNPARLSLAEQMDLLKNARAIIGAFGTELYCLLNLPAGSSVIELRSRPEDNMAFGLAATFVGVRHHVILCKKAEDRGTATYRRDTDMIVDCAQLRACLAAL